MVNVLNEVTAYKTALAEIKAICRRSKRYKVDFGFDFVRIKNPKCLHIIYVEPSRIESVQKLFKDFNLLCLRFCEVV